MLSWTNEGRATASRGAEAGLEDDRWWSRQLFSNRDSRSSLLLLGRSGGPRYDSSSSGFVSSGRSLTTTERRRKEKLNYLSIKSSPVNVTHSYISEHMINSHPLTSSAWSAPSPPGAPGPPRPKEPSLCSREFWVLVFRCGSGLPASPRLWLLWTPELCCWRTLWACSIRPGWGVWRWRERRTRTRGESLFYGPKNDKLTSRGTLNTRCYLCGVFLRGRAAEVCDSRRGQTLYSFS